MLNVCVYYKFFVYLNRKCLFKFGGIEFILKFVCLWGLCVLGRYIGLGSILYESECIMSCFYVLCLFDLKFFFYFRVKINYYKYFFNLFFFIYDYFDFFFLLGFKSF